MGITGATLNRGNSDQSIATPWEFIHAIEARWNIEFSVDLASEEITSKARYCITPEMDTFTVNWTDRLRGDVGWLNPPFNPVEPFLKKCVEEAHKGARLIVLTRGDLCTNWYWDLIHPNAAIYAIQPRLQFVGQTAPYPFPLILSTWNLPFKEKLNRWRWK